MQKKISWKKTRTADGIKDVLGTLFSGGRLSDERFQGMTITHVALTKDQRLATVYYRNFLSVSKEKLTKALKHSVPYIRCVLADRLGVRRVPYLRFVFDVSVDRGAHVEHLMKNIQFEGDEVELLRGPSGL